MTRRRSQAAEGAPGELPARYVDLVEVATRLFSEHGYERTTVRTIADEMGIKSGSLYSHIRSKEDILRRIVLGCAEAILVGVRGVITDSQTPEERLRAICRAHLGMIRNERREVTIYFDEWQKLDPETRARVVALRNEYERLLTEVIEEGVERGDFGPVDVRFAVLTLVSSLNWSYRWYDPAGPLGPEAVADGFVDIVLSGLRRRPPNA